ncbi:MSMEG_0567/Sll0786 family nitrogen starvation N-acetyltransferase [Halalkalibacter nanhaiisediminis]|uniref:Putative N-acetyltransferase (TIGR04045 family) n=1 Tax=Halalkalibacter nanhaiisediminis TaxID=688079 RepID=A0A562QQU8_9BACI|nr:MSMEG_0567/Sll0786 family nitrogen starvation N-acetyltransferase [Halalkalibacter nanhaiisediminis]TWI59104.1 putative N-acetyltransferase (TIGR04045 family) [Halalkalibacter nanhaiisediminis]
MLRNYVIKVATTDQEIQESFALRKLVFVEEQQLFQETDADEHDKHAIYINAYSVKKQQLVGTVRCYEDHQNLGVWWGGRLAVQMNYRVKGIGVYLIRSAVEEVRQRHARRFLATVQAENIRLFEKLGWEQVEELFTLNGFQHQMMEVSCHEFHKARQHA